MNAAWSNHLWQSTAFAIAAGLLTLAFRGNRAQVRYWLWFGASLKFLAPFALLVSLGARLDPAPAIRPVAASAVVLTVVQATRPFADSLPAAPPANPPFDWLPLVWVCGFTIVLSIRWRAWLRVRAAVRAGTRVDWPIGVEVRSSPGLLEPGIVGVWRPVLLLPAGLAQHLTPTQMEAVLAHELCHVSRRDNLTAAVHMVVEAVFWFHPLVWWIGARLVAERERACDEAVLLRGSEPHDYAQAILNVCKLCVESPLASVSGVTGADLKRRVHAILSGRAAMDLSIGKKTCLAAAVAVALAAPLLVGMLEPRAIRAQSAPANRPKFEVASIRPCKIGVDGGGGGGARSGGTGGGRSPSRLTTRCETVANLIQSAYVSYGNGYLSRDPSNPVIEGAPAWIRSERYQISAKAEGTPGDAIMNGPMMQTLLEDRLQVRVHRDSKEVPVYALTVAKGGPKLPAFREGSCTPMDFGRVGRLPGNCIVLIRRNGSNQTIEGPGVTMRDFAKMLYYIVDRPVVDRTALPGRFEIHLEFAPEEATPVFHMEVPADLLPASPAEPPTAPSIFTVLQQQLGLKLEPARGAHEILVVDRVKRPSAN